MKFSAFPKFVQNLYPRGTLFHLEAEKTIFLSFDDGPHPFYTPLLLRVLEDYNAKATFFCTGKNAEEYTEVFNQIIEKGHAIGNHTYSHLNSFKVNNGVYLQDVKKAEKHISSSLFRPPYGKLSPCLASQIKRMGFTLVFWDVLSYDWLAEETPESVCRRVLDNVKEGSIIVFHDSEKAGKTMLISVSIILKHYTEKGFTFKKLS